MTKQLILAKVLTIPSILTGLLITSFCFHFPLIAGEITEMSETEMETELIKSDKDETSAMEEKMNLLEVAMETGDFQILVAAIKAAGLEEKLSGEGKFTVFAPTDKAFLALGEDTLKELLKPENQDQLIAILNYHVVPGMVTSSDLETGQVKTVEGSTVDINIGESVKVNEAVVIDANIQASNGIIHIIDTVILPPKK